MTIPRVHFWTHGEEVFPSQISQLDRNITYRLDKRAGRSDTLASNIIVNSIDGYVEFLTGSELIINSSTFEVDDGYLNLNAAIEDETNALRFGLVSINLIDSGVVNLTGDLANAFGIKFTGTVLPPDLVAVNFPDKGSTGLMSCNYTKMIDNQSNMFLRCSTVHGNNSFDISPGEKYLIYCDSIDIWPAATLSLSNIVVDQKESSVSTFVVNQNVVQTTSSAFQNFPGISLSFTNVEEGDFFDICLSGQMNYFNGTNGGSLVVVYTENSNIYLSDPYPTVLQLTQNNSAAQYNSSAAAQQFGTQSIVATFLVPTQIFSFGGQTFGNTTRSTRTIYTAPNTPINNTYNFNVCYASVYDGKSTVFAAPISLKITQYRPLFDEGGL